ncbi:hypothetical protein C0J52_05568 [Blattella germanica]|nr:hypothetical protein C0J52_05568 [Blattella germanica]
MWKYVLLACVLICFKSAVVVAQQVDPVGAECLQCICYATSNCDLSGGCSEDACGPYGITWEYWSDAARPVLPFIDGAYVKCTNNKECAERTLQNYMLRDCNSDSKITCYDFAAVHRLGGDSCGGQLDDDYLKKLATCFEHFTIE